MGINTAVKGAGIELKAIGHLESQGFRCDRAIRKPIIVHGRVVGSHANDIFGCFDIQAVRREPAAIRYVQTTVISAVAARRGKVLEMVPFFPDLPGVSIEVWGWIGGARTVKNPGGQSFNVWLWSFDELDWVVGPTERLVPGAKLERDMTEV